MTTAIAVFLFLFGAVCALTATGIGLRNLLHYWRHPEHGKHRLRRTGRECTFIVVVPKGDKPWAEPSLQEV